MWKRLVFVSTVVCWSCGPVLAQDAAQPPGGQPPAAQPQAGQPPAAGAAAPQGSPPQGSPPQAPQASQATGAPQAPQPSQATQDRQAAPAPQPAADAKPGSDATATEWTYRTKDGSMYKPPAERPKSPAQDYDVYGRT